MSEGSFPRKAEGGGGSGGFQSLRESRAKRQLGRDLTGVSRLKQGLEVGIQDQESGTIPFATSDENAIQSVPQATDEAHESNSQAMDHSLSLPSSPFSMNEMTPSAPDHSGPSPLPSAPFLDQLSTTLSSSSSSPSSRYPDFPTSLLEIRDSPTRGRGLFVSSHHRIARGSTIISTAPLTAVLSTRQLPHACSYCWLSPYELSVRDGQMGLAVDDGDGGRGGGDMDVDDAKGKGKEVTVVQPNGGGVRYGLKRCTGCSVVRYCSKTCQSLAWSTHAPECKALSRLRWLHSSSNSSSSDELASVPEESVRALGRLCWERKRTRAKKTNTGRTADASKPLEQVKYLETHRSDLSDRQKQSLAQLALTLAHYLNAGDQPRIDPKSEQASRMSPDEKARSLTPADMREFGFGGVGEVMDLCSAFATNSFTLSSPSLSPIGVAISPLTALLNHSCVPNAVVVFPGGSLFNNGKSMIVNALRDIKPGEEVLTAYIDVSLPYKMRQKQLKENYHFTCRCELCEKEERDESVDPRSAVIHPGCQKNGTGKMPDMRSLTGVEVICTACSEIFTVPVPRLHNLLEAADEMLEADQKQQLAADHVQLMPSIVKSLLDLMPPSSYPLSSLLRLQALLDCSPTPDGTSVVNPGRAIQATALAWKGMTEVYPAGHPSIGIALAELGKLLNLESDSKSFEQPLGQGRGLVIPSSMIARRNLAQQTMIRAVEELQIGFGPTGGLVANELRGLVQGLGHELTMYAQAQQQIRN